jgi:selenocysteine-specific elongation factor
VLIGTAGHIDHGKTAVVKALTGVDADRLPEEKARGMTLDLGYAYVPLPDGTVLGFVDVPGHERLIHNMLAGATGVDFFLLVVAADDGPMPQTREHVGILDLLGLVRGAVVLNKTDLVDAGRIAEVTAEVRALLAPTGLAGTPVFPVSARTGEGLDGLRRFLEAASAATAPRQAGGRLRLAVDRCFTLTGTGTVVTGTVFSGQVHVGDRLTLSPAGIAVRVRGLHAQNRPADRGLPGERCALNLAGVERSDIRRGDWVLDPTLHAPTARLDARLRLLPDEAKPLRHWTPVHLHLAAEDVPARVALLQGELLAPGEEGRVQLLVNRPIGALHGDRFILRDQSATRTIGGGCVTDPFAPSRGRRTPTRMATLAALEQAEPGAALAGVLQATEGAINLDRFALARNLGRETIEGLLSGLDAVRVESGGVRLALTRARWKALGDAVRVALAAEHERAPEALGPNAEQLRRLACPSLDRAVASRLLEDLRAAGVVARTGPWLHLPGHQVHLPPAEALLWDRIHPLLLSDALHPPRVRDIAHRLGVAEGVVRLTLRRVAAMGNAYQVAHDHFFLPASVARLAAIAVQAADSADGVAAAVFRDQIGTGRKLAIQILEFFDRVGFTRRIGDHHRVLQPELFAGSQPQ